MISKSSWRVRVAIWSAVFGALLVFTIVLGNYGILQKPSSPFEVRSEYVGKGVHNKPFAVVFVHGIFGDKKNTWSNRADAFPALLAADPEYQGTVDEFLFEYYTPMFGNAAGIVGLAEHLRGSLEDNNVFANHQHVVFLSHSMGGLIVRQFLLTNRGYLNQIPMLFFYATPTNGTDLTLDAHKLSTNPQLRGMLPIQGNDLLRSIQAQWLRWPEVAKIPSHCAYEELETDGVMVVPIASATALCTQIDSLTANHIEIVKPTDRGDPRYSRFATALRETKRENGNGQAKEQPRKEGDQDSKSSSLDFDASNETSSFPVEGHFKGKLTRSSTTLTVSIDKATLALRRIDAFPSAPPEVNIIALRAGITRFSTGHWDIVRGSSEIPVHQSLVLNTPPLSLTLLKMTIPLSGLALEANDALVFSIVSGHPGRGDVGEMYVHVPAPIPAGP